jgi:MFS transporter, FHS family, Na+ dependent glucose transporter 1
MPTWTTAMESPATTRATKLAQTAVYYVAFIALGMASASLGPTLGGLAEHTRTRLNEISFLFMARSLGYLVGSFVGGRVYDRWPGHIVMVGIFVGMAAMLALAPMMPLLWLLTAVLLVLGMGEGAMDVGGNILLMWVHRSKVGPFMNGLHFAWGLGAFLSPIIVAQAVLISGDITWAYWALAILMLPVTLGLLRVPSPVAPASRHVTSESKQVQHVLLVVLIALFLFLYVGAEGSLGGWLYTYTVTLRLSSGAAAAYLTSAFWGSLTVGRLLAIPLAARLRPRDVLLLDLVGCLVSMGLIVVWPNSLVAVWAGAIGTGLSMASIFPTTLSLAESRMHITGTITSWFFVGSSLGGMTVPWIIGQLFEPVGPYATMLTIASAVALMTGVFVAMMLAARKVGASAA